jgi:hypothetical protein
VSLAASMLADETAHCLRLVAAGAGWDAFVLDKARTLDRRRTYRGIAGAVEGAILDTGRALPQPWKEPEFTEVFAIPANYMPMTPIQTKERK